MLEAKSNNLKEIGRLESENKEYKLFLIYFSTLMQRFDVVPRTHKIQESKSTTTEEIMFN